MAYDEEQAKRSRVVVETPTARREVVHSEAVRVPERSGISSATVGIVVVLAIALLTILVLFYMNRQSNDNANANLAAAQQPAPVPQTTIIQQPAPQQPPVIIQQPAPATQPVIINPAVPAGGAATSGANVPDDSSIQAEIDKKIADDPALSTLGIIATVLNGKVTLVGAVKTETLKLQVERMVRRIKGVKAVDNQIIVA